MKNLYKRREELYKRLEEDLSVKEFEEIRREISNVTLQIDTEENIGTKDYRSVKSQTSSINKGGNKPKMKM